jgi:hypothetical protein
MATKQDSSPARQLFVEFLQDHLGIEFVGFQRAFGHGSDLILFRGPLGSTLSVPTDTMHEPREKAQEIVRAKIAASEVAFRSAVDDELAEVCRRYWVATSRAARLVSETHIGRELAKRGVELRGGQEAA